MQNFDILIKFLSYLDLDFDESRVYLKLLELRSTTILELSRKTKISRTNVYRIVDRLKEKGFVEEVEFGKKKLIHPSGMHKLEVLIKEQESKTEFLRNIFPEISSIIPASESVSQPGTKVMFYKGVDGIKQILWNTLNSQGECLSYYYHNIKDLVDADFEESWKKEFQYRRLKFRALSDDPGLSIEKNLSDNFVARFISPDMLTVREHQYIYSGVVAFVYKEGDDLYGVEIHNKNNSKLQQQLFESVWRLGTEI